jgi:glutamate-1-semialdehyde aminotransferase
MSESERLFERAKALIPGGVNSQVRALARRADYSGP